MMKAFVHLTAFMGFNESLEYLFFALVAGQGGGSSSCSRNIRSKSPAVIMTLYLAPRAFEREDWHSFTVYWASRL
eukprot:scaffold62820_cov32-Attheya_sp.AAC.3